MATSTLPQNLQEAAITISSEKIGCPSQESLPKFKGQLFLMPAFQVYHMCREHGRTLQNLLRWKELQSMCGGGWGGGTP